MSTETRNMHHGEAGYEQQDLGGRPIYVFLIVLAIACVVVAVALWGGYRAVDAYLEGRQVKQGPLARAPRPSDSRNAQVPAINEEIIKTIPRPRLEENERTELREFREQEDARLHSYGWVDASAGTVHVPIDRAMELIAQRGLPTEPRVGTVPPSEVNVVKEAAAKADTSASSQGKK